MYKIREKVVFQSGRNGLIWLIIGGKDQNVARGSKLMHGTKKSLNQGGKKFNKMPQKVPTAGSKVSKFPQGTLMIRKLKKCVKEIQSIYLILHSF